MWLGIPLALLCVWLLFFCVPVMSQIESKKGELAGVEARIARLEAERSHPQEMVSGGASEDIHPYRLDQIPRLQAFPDFMKQIASSVRKGGVVVDRLKGRLDDGGVGTGSSFAHPVTELAFTGQFLDIGRALEQIQTVKAYRRILRAHLIGAEGMGPVVKGSVEIEFRAWRD
ncbi:MAG TPA: hypothetical protein DCR97_10450 [Deltaproteobacteria bacterium]|nr:hypothetical protein [Deltaproteobacteria bacterium]